MKQGNFQSLCLLASCNKTLPHEVLSKRFAIGTIWRIEEMFLLSEEMNETRPNLLLLFITCTAVRIYVISYHLEVVVGLLFDDSIIILVLMILILVAKKLTKAK